MKLKTRIGAAAGFGVMAFGVCQAIESFVGGYNQDISTQVEACAAQLGNVAVSTTELPDACAERRYSFAYTQGITRSYDPERRRATEVNQPIVYELPPADTYRQTYLVTAEAARADDEVSDILLGGVSILVSLGTLAALTATSRYDEKHPRAAEVAEQLAEPDMNASRPL